MTNREITSDNDMDTSSDDDMEVTEEGETENDHFNLSKEWAEKIKQTGNSLSCVHEFMDADAPEKINENSFGDVFIFAESMSLKKKNKTPVAKTRGSYRKCTVEQIEKLFDFIIEEGFIIKDAALVSGINLYTAQNYVKTYNNDSQKRLPGTYNKPCGRSCSKLTKEHSKFFVDYVKKNTTAVLDELKLKLRN
ncbi:uncharacterized protein RHIMIDRAFT_291260 [Rhizopus microsporus ATCC 52813]|uniref:Uncharacterized protein n=1 Tax=Rhizopus microsporus ATCC 52813 TaxID=1340429 RepID=A0A2G4SXR4_RHIZD|nr:uncharacterized protein RHIMIDRAFT_291260 [Rhizopus microsporus ATCC 52813]PHZ13569.1 hypothetical protein RHIMIDRAFT_291260 [Rhizopus microsporus ATCC 52813]